jgi:hypothetical protein
MFVGKGARVFQNLRKIIVYFRITKVQTRPESGKNNIRPAFTSMIAAINDTAIRGPFKGKRTRIRTYNVSMLGECNSVIALGTWNV